MVKTAISDLGTDVELSPRGAEYEPVLGDGTSKPGWACYIDSVGRAKGVDANSATAGLAFGGFLTRHPELGLDVVLTTDKAGALVVPASKEKYRVFIEDFGAAGLKGSPLTWGTTTPGSLMVIATVTGKLETGASNIIAYLEDAVENGDLVANIRWA